MSHCHHKSRRRKCQRFHQMISFTSASLSDVPTARFSEQMSRHFTMIEDQRFSFAAGRPTEKINHWPSFIRILLGNFLKQLLAASIHIEFRNERGAVNDWPLGRKLRLTDRHDR